MQYADSELDRLGGPKDNPLRIIQEDCEELRCRKFEVKCELHEVMVHYA